MLVGEGIILGVVVASLLLRLLLGRPVLDEGYVWGLMIAVVGGQILLIALGVLPFPYPASSSRARRHVARTPPSWSDSDEMVRRGQEERDRAGVVETEDGVLRPWQWELKETGSGPGHAAWLRFSEESPGLLEAAIAGFEPSGFVLHRHQERGERVLTYINQTRSEAFADNVSGRRRKNLWTYRRMVVRGSTLLMENGYGDSVPKELAMQTLLLRSLAQEPGLTVVEWKICSSDTGFLLAPVAEGRAAAELIAYLRVAPGGEDANHSPAS